MTILLLTYLESLAKESLLVLASKIKEAFSLFLVLRDLFRAHLPLSNPLSKKRFYMSM
jgi:hypothetical protein